MRCPRCDFDNTNHTRFCEQCGALLEEDYSPASYSSSGSEEPAYTEASIYGSYADQYQPPPPPPLNGHNRILPPPPPLELAPEPYETYSRQSQLLGNLKIQEERPRWTVGRVIRSIIYFVAVAFSAFWLLGGLVEINQSGLLPYFAFFAGIVMLIGSIVTFVQLRHRSPRLTFSRFLLFFLAVTVLAGLAAIVEAAIVPDLSINPAASFILAMIFMVYCLVVAICALW